MLLILLADSSLFLFWVGRLKRKRSEILAESKRRIYFGEMPVKLWIECTLFEENYTADKITSPGVVP